MTSIKISKYFIQLIIFIQNLNSLIEEFTYLPHKEKIITSLLESLLILLNNEDSGFWKTLVSQDKNYKFSDIDIVAVVLDLKFFKLAFSKYLNLNSFSIIDDMISFIFLQYKELNDIDLSNKSEKFYSLLIKESVDDNSILKNILDSSV
jgi:hypothetical protein